MSSAKQEILDRIRGATADITTEAKGVPAPTGTASPGATPPEGIGPETTPPGTAPEAAILDRFAEAVADYEARVLRVHESNLPDTIAQVLRDVDCRSVIVPDGIDAEWTGSLGTAPEVVRDTPSLAAADLDRVDAVLTASAVGIAATGTIVLDHRADQGRRALTLVPDTHVCVVRTDQVVADVPDAVSRLRPDPRDARPLTWISGPSATSDIELERVEGVHGPRTLVVLLVSA
ncbi:LUD domain-containing protein [Janibacter cremeus]|uniref:LutC/YkgG family protein n=1 Tax=Janibacter cremeus TaxID=1285192 RepID=UPI0023F9BF7F|nr:LUD domain-containing protein [Janibacter cremeus]WEV77541.1 LUD domain-containing protein [Janibacter cremeus]